jgi:hypothetical protein
MKGVESGFSQKIAVLNLESAHNGDYASTS